MVIFESEADLLLSLDQHDQLVRECVRGEVAFDRFVEKYNNFYALCALDGHESDEEERALLEKYAERIEPHRIIAFEILGQVCADEDSVRESYKQAGRFGSAEGVAMLGRVRL